MSANVKSILANANLTETEGKIILDNLGVAAELFPFFKDKLSSGFSLGNEVEESGTEETDEAVSSKSCDVKIAIIFKPGLNSNRIFIKFCKFFRYAIYEGF